MSVENQILPGHIEAFISALKSVGKGQLSEEAARHLSEAVKATMTEGKKSTVIIRLEITKANEEMITLAGTAEARIPKPKPSGSFFVDPMKGYQIGRNRPDQQILQSMGS